MCKSCRSRKMFQTEYLVAKIGVDTAENEPLQIWTNIEFNIHFGPLTRGGGGRPRDRGLPAAPAHGGSALARPRAHGARRACGGVRGGGARRDGGRQGGWEYSAKLGSKTKYSEYCV